MMRIDLSWADIDAMVDELVDKFEKEYEYVVGIMTGGVVVASLIAKAIDAKMGFVGVRRYDGYKGGEIEHYFTKVEVIDDEVLLVDDIVDRGDTMSYVYNRVLLRQADTATLVLKEGSNFIPDYHVKRVDKDIWVKFPWEVR